jgi:hypothetical protein
MKALLCFACQNDYLTTILIMQDKDSRDGKG